MEKAGCVEKEREAVEKAGRSENARAGPRRIILTGGFAVWWETEVSKVVFDGNEVCIPYGKLSFAHLQALISASWR